MLAASAFFVGLAFAVWTGWSASIEDVYTLVFVAFALVWVASPYLVLAGYAFWLVTNWVSRVVVALSLCGCAGFGVWMFDMIDEDAQGGLIVVFGPLYQFGGLVIPLGIVLVIEVVRGFSPRRGENDTGCRR